MEDHFQTEQRMGEENTGSKVSLRVWRCMSISWRKSKNQSSSYTHLQLVSLTTGTFEKRKKTNNSEIKKLDSISWFHGLMMSPDEGGGTKELQVLALKKEQNGENKGPRAGGMQWQKTEIPSRWAYFCSHLKYYITHLCSIALPPPGPAVHR